MYVFVLYAALIWAAAYTYRRKWQAWAVLGLSIPAAMVVTRVMEFLVGNANFFLRGGAMVYEALILLVGVVIAVQPRTRPALHACKRCKYDLAGNTSGRCPECGTLIPGGYVPAPAASTPATLS